LCAADVPEGFRHSTTGFGVNPSDYKLLAATALSLLLSGSGEEGARFSESAAGMTAKHVMMQEGALEMAAANLRHPEAELLVLQQTSANLASAICFGARPRRRRPCRRDQF
jgi:hypothetical protein